MPRPAAELPEYACDLGSGVYVIDTGFQRPRFDAAYLVVDGGRAAFIDTGTNHAVPRLLATLDALGVERDAVDFVIPTHVHLDHAGGAGLLMRALPVATLVVHPRGERHMIDPIALVEGALSVYGAAEMERSYGRVVAVDAARIRTSHEGMNLTLGQDRVLHFIDTPGHARHHHCLWDLRTRGWFSGDTFGSSYRELDTAHGAWMFPNTVPVQFDPPALRASVQRLLSFEPACMYVTHYGRLAGDVQGMADRVLSLLDAMVALAERHRGAQALPGALASELETLYANGLKAHGVDNVDDKLSLLAMDIDLNAQGLAVWLQRTPHESKAHTP